VLKVVVVVVVVEVVVEVEVVVVEVVVVVVVVVVVEVVHDAVLLLLLLTTMMRNPLHAARHGSTPSPARSVRRDANAQGPTHAVNPGLWVVIESTVVSRCRPACVG
jgi:hypothetical protein